MSNPDTDNQALADDSHHSGYWRANIKILSLLLSIWFIVSFGMGILAVDWLDQFKLGGFPFGFWMAQQGSIIVFLLLILVYRIWMNKLDKKYGVEEVEEKSQDYEI